MSDEAMSDDEAEWKAIDDALAEWGAIIQQQQRAIAECRIPDDLAPSQPFAIRRCRR